MISACSLLKAQWRFLLAVIFLSNVVVRGPDVVAYLTTPDNLWFTGQASWFDPQDINNYLSTINWGKRGGLLIPNLYDTVYSTPSYLYPFYILLGKLAGVLNLSPAVAFHGSAVVTSALLILVLWWFLSFIIKKTESRKMALLILVFGGGLGWLLFSSHILLPDVTLSIFTLQGPLRSPHEAVSWSLFLLSLGTYVLRRRGHSRSFQVISVFSAFLLPYFHPYLLVAVGATVTLWALYWFYTERSLAGIPFLVELGGVGGVYWFTAGRQLASNTTFAGIHHLLASPPIWQIVLGWGVIAPLLYWSIKDRKRKPISVLLMLWLVAHLVLLYLPLTFQKQFLKGMWVPAVLLAVVGWENRMKPRSLLWQKRHLIVLFAALTPLFIGYQRLTKLVHSPWTRVPLEVKTLFEATNRLGRENDGILAGYQTSNMMPVFTNKRVWLGHWPQTPDIEARQHQLINFYSGKMKPDEVVSFLKNQNISLVIWGPEEQTLVGTTVFPYTSVFPPVASVSAATTVFAASR